MFDQTFVDGAGKTNTSWTVTLSFVAEFAAIGVTILVPLIWTQVLPRVQSANSLTAPAPPPPSSTPAPAPVTRQARIAPRVFRQVLEAPREIPRQVPMIIESIALPPANRGDAVSGVPNTTPAGTAGVFAGGIAFPVPPPSPAPAQVNVQPKRENPLPVGGNVQSAKLIKHPAPIYPAIARSARIQGKVVLQAIIGKDGAVRNLKVIGATSPLLVASAMDAVKQWVYQPTLLNQQPVEVITEITVIFALQDVNVRF